MNVSLTLAAYARDSGGESQELSIPQQEAALKAWADQNGYMITLWFKDEARPGSSVVGRDGFHAMMAHFRHGNAPEAGVVVWKMSRFSRDLDDSMFYRADLRRRGYKVISINDNIPEGPEGRFFEAAIDWMSERFLEDLSRDVKRGLSSLVQTYGAVPGTPPRGFLRQPLELPPHRDGRPHIVHRWAPDPDYLPRIRQAFGMLAAGETLTAIHAATHLYNSINSYKTFFTNRLYIGVLEFGDLVIENYCEPVVDQATWDAVQIRIQKRSPGRRLSGDNPSHPRRQNGAYLLSGLVYCAICGSPTYGHTIKFSAGNAYEYYACTRAKRNRDCPAAKIPRIELEAAVLADLVEYILSPENLQARQAELIRSQAERQAAILEQRRDLNRRLGSLRRQITNTATAISEAGHSRALLAKLADLEAQENELLSQLSELDRQEQPLEQLDPADIDARAARLKANLAGEDSADLRTILHGLLYKIIIERDGRIIRGQIIYYHPPEDPPKKAPPPQGGEGARVLVDEFISIPPFPLGALAYRHKFSHPFTFTLKRKSRS